MEGKRIKRRGGSEKGRGGKRGKGEGRKRREGGRWSV